MSQVARQSAGHANNACVRSLRALSAQLEFAIAEADGPVDELGQTIGQLAALLRDLSGATQSAPASDGTRPKPATSKPAASKLDEVRDELYNGIVKMQFYDRLVQQLANIQDYLNRIAHEIESGTPQRYAGDGSPEAQSWETLRCGFRRKLMTAEQRRILDELLPPPDGLSASPDETPENDADCGSTELF